MVGPEILRKSLLLVGMGLTIGVGLALGASRLVGSLLYGISPYDPLAYVAAAAALLLAAIIAAWLPAARAANVSPVVALRHD